MAQSPPAATSRRSALNYVSLSAVGFFLTSQKTQRGLLFFQMAEPKQLLTPSAVQRAIERMAAEIAERNETHREAVVVGIQRGSIPLAGPLAVRLSKIWYKQIPCGVVDVSMHRDDLHQ